jgi:hypothetical protein
MCLLSIGNIWNDNNKCAIWESKQGERQPNANQSLRKMILKVYFSFDTQKCRQYPHVFILIEL